MKKLSEINEDMTTLFGRMSLNKVNKEDDMGNIRDIKFVDFGTDVLWASSDFEISGNNMFEYSEVSDFSFGKYRIPTFNDYADLMNKFENNIEILFDFFTKNQKIEYITDCGEKKRGDKSKAFYWIKEYDNSGYKIKAFEIVDLKRENKLGENIIKRFIGDSTIKDYLNAEKLPVRLVKDK